MKIRITPEKRQKAVLLSGLYTSQMLGLSFVISALPAILRQAGVGLGEIGWIYGLSFFRSLNFLWAPMVDRIGSEKHGHYRSWLIGMQLLLILVIVAASFFTVPDQLATLMVLFAFLAAISATQDIAADALAVTILDPEERGLGNSIQTVGNLIGCMIGGGVVLMVYQWLGWQGSLLILAAGTALPLISILFHQEGPAPADHREEKVDFGILVQFFRRPGIWRWIPVLLVFRAGNVINYVLLTPLLVDLGWSLERIGFSINIVGPFFGIAGSALVGWMVSRWSRKVAMLFSMLLVALATTGLFVLSRGIDHTVIIYTIIGGIMAGYGASFTVMYTIVMDKSDASSAGSDVTLQMSISGLSAFAVIALATQLAAIIGYTGVIVACLGISIVSLFLIWNYDDFDTTDPTYAAACRTTIRAG
jgi:predicted MFS family arabinose efflux permease